MTSIITFEDLVQQGVRAYVLRNRHGQDSDYYQKIIVSLLQAAGLPVDVGTFQAGTGQAKKMAKAAVQSGKYGIIIPVGGDGTINKAVKAAVKHGDGKVVIAPVAGGTVNHVSRMLYGNHDSKQPWINVLGMLEAAVRKIDVGVVESRSVERASGASEKLPKHLRKKGYFLLSASAGAEATVIRLAPKQLKYRLDHLVPGAGFLVLAFTALFNLSAMRRFSVEIADRHGKPQWKGHARAAIVASADYGWEGGSIHIDDGSLKGVAMTSLFSLVTRRPASPVFHDEKLHITMPANVQIGVDGSLSHLTRELAGGSDELAALDHRDRITYRYDTRKVPMLVPYSIPQPLLTKKLPAIPRSPAAPAAIAATEFMSDSAMTVKVIGIAGMPSGRRVVYAENADGRPVTLRVDGDAAVCRRDSSSPLSIAEVRSGMSVQVAGDATEWGTDVRKLLI